MDATTLLLQKMEEGCCEEICFSEIELTPEEEKELESLREHLRIFKHTVTGDRRHED